MRPMPEATVAKPRLTYRPDIDGLRAVAVLLVLAVHLRTRFTGGYIGVDVFFVISGYLISNVILSELGSGTFSIVTFYERRIRRIFPAMLAMMAVTTVLVYRFSVPNEVEGYGRSLLAALFSSSNFLFWHEAGYFDTSSAAKPLLHTWSLAVEEQFYIVFPLFLMLVRRFAPRRMRVAILALLALSLAAAAIAVRHDTTAAFFFAPLRAWELLLGTVVSQRYLPSLRGVVARNLGSALGLGLIVASAIRYDATTPFPGLAAIPPCLGAALILAAGETGSSLIGRALALRPVVFVGLISYSLYLWHWPILVFQESNNLLVAGVVQGAKAKVVVVAVSLVVATLSWALVEQPFRTGRFRPGRKKVFLINGLAVAALALIAAGMVLGKGFPERFPPEARQIATYSGRTLDEPAFREADCFVGDQNRYSDYKPQVCLAPSGAVPAKPAILLLGDSHALHLYPGLAQAFPQYDILQATAAGCVPPLRMPARNPSDCERLGDFVFQSYLPRHHVDLVLLSGHWHPAEFDRLQATIEYVHGLGMKVAVVGPNMEYGVPLPRLLATAMRDRRPERVASYWDEEPREVDRTMAVQAREVWRVPYLSVFAELCAPECPVLAAPGVPMLIDTNHLSAEGSLLLAQKIRDRGELQAIVGR